MTYGNELLKVNIIDTRAITDFTSPFEEDETLPFWLTNDFTIIEVNTEVFATADRTEGESVKFYIIVDPSGDYGIAYIVAPHYAYSFIG